MKSSTPRSEELRRQRSQALVETRIAAIFQQLPMLSGFSLRHDLEMTDIAICTWPGHSAGEELYDDLMQALADLAEERPPGRGRGAARPHLRARLPVN